MKITENTTVMDLYWEIELRKRSTMTLGAIITCLREFNQDCKIEFDFGHIIPLGFISWRGSYNELALLYGYSSNRHVYVKDLLRQCEEANGMTFAGYNCGEFKMSLDTPVWVDNDGDISHTAIIDIKEVGEYVYIITERDLNYNLQ